METEPHPFEATIAAIRAQVPADLAAPRIGIVCGSGLSTLASHFRDKVEVAYDSLPGFVKSTVAGHKSAFAFGRLGEGQGIPVVAMLGRFHPYEGYPMAKATYPIRVMKRLGVQSLLITNATGSLNPAIPVGTIVIIQDHLSLPSLTGMNPLLGPNYPPYPRFLPMSNAYSRRLRKLVFHGFYKLQSKLNMSSANANGKIDEQAIQEGTYAYVSGPTYETPAEGRFLRAAGADVVGMSTIPEVIVAREEDMEVCVLSLVTNFVVIPAGYRSIREEVEAELAGKPLEAVQDAIVSHEEVLEVGQRKAELMRELIEIVVPTI
ncbi:related to PNP1-purine-nucleoside phosphorylase [Serendipita indica DSM 11827]|uniref:Purine nucleoside phosphorylase n=1 Tax=Serendipita indica (strain DSM 11827) TaxID=1109443 RepID=G4TYA7_SERID|nr:related to PNP1-purine-nucleoside phosphorylase [Serendipita indica DSM 11827]